MRRGLATIAFAVVLLAVGSAFANHDQGLGHSQDHLHRNSQAGGGPSANVVAVPEPSSAAMLTLGVGVVAPRDVRPGGHRGDDRMRES